MAAPDVSIPDAPDTGDTPDVVDPAPPTPEVVATPTPPAAFPSTPDFAAVRAAMPPGIGDHKIFDAYVEGEEPRGIRGLMEDFIGAQSLVGMEKITRPNEKFTEKDWDKFYSELGRPETPDGYDLGDFEPRPESNWDPNLQKAMMQRLHSAGLTNAQMNKTMRDFEEVQYENNERARAYVQSMHDAAERSLRESWGAGYDAMVNGGIRAFKEAFGEDAEAVSQIVLPDGHTIADHPLFVKAFAELAGKFSEDAFTGARPGSGFAWTREQALDIIEQMNNDPHIIEVLATRNHPERKEIQHKRDAAYRTAYPE